MSKKKYYQVDTKKIDRPSVEAKSGGGKGNQEEVKEQIYLYQI